MLSAPSIAIPKQVSMDWNNQNGMKSNSKNVAHATITLKISATGVLFVSSPTSSDSPPSPTLVRTVVRLILRTLRRVRGHKQTDAAAALGKCLDKPISQSYLSWTETKANLSWHRFAAICAAYEALPSEVVGLAEAVSSTKPRTVPRTNAKPFDDDLKRLISRIDKLNNEHRIKVFSKNSRSWRDFAACIGPALKVIRVEKDVRQIKVANALSKRNGKPISKNYISNVEAGTKNLSWVRLGKVCNYLGCSISEVLRGAEIIAQSRQLPLQKRLLGVIELAAEEIAKHSGSASLPNRDQLLALQAINVMQKQANRRLRLLKSRSSRRP